MSCLHASAAKQALGLVRESAVRPCWFGPESRLHINECVWSTSSEGSTPRRLLLLRCTASCCLRARGKVPEPAFRHSCCRVRSTSRLATTGSPRRTTPTLRDTSSPPSPPPTCTGGSCCKGAGSRERTRTAVRASTQPPILSKRRFPCCIEHGDGIIALPL
eukprot:2315139-Pleurochrysis_carterae.AAC.1